MENQPINPLLVAFLSFAPATPTVLNPGSWGATVAQVVASTSFDVTLSSQFAGGIAIGDVAKSLHATVSLKEGASVTIAVTAIANGLRIVFGTALTQPLTIKIEKLVTE